MEVTEPVHILVLHHLADKFGALLLRAGNDFVDVFDGEHDATDAQCVHRCVCRLSTDCRWPMEFRQLEPTVAVRGPHQGDVASDAVEPDDAVYPLSLNFRLTFQLQTKFDKERDSSLEVSDKDSDVVHP